jgi:hypothetical protein
MTEPINEMMSKAERDELAKVVRLRVRVTKASLETIAADRRADVERQLSAEFKADDDAWRALTAETKRMVQEANAQLGRTCEELGICERFRPTLGLYFSDRGENAVVARRTELRKLAYARIEADQKAGNQLTPGRPRA